jgi:serine protease AprX
MRKRTLLSVTLLCGMLIAAGSHADRDNARIGAPGFQGQEPVQKPGLVENQRDYTLTLGEMRFDPVERMPEIPEAWRGEGHPNGDLRLIQFFGPTQQAWLDQIEAAGVEVVQYIDPFTYIVWGEADAMEQARNLDIVRWSGEFEPAYRVRPHWRNLDESVQDVRVLVYNGADLETLRANLRREGATTTGFRKITEKLSVMSLTIPGNRFVDAAKVAGRVQRPVQCLPMVACAVR